MESLRTPAPFLPDDLTLEILSKVSLKALHRLKWVCRSWFSLITNQVLAQYVNSPNLSFYYTHYSSSKSFDFLPNYTNSRSDELVIFDSCNGLVLCSNQHWGETCYYVCNPVDKSYKRILAICRIPFCFMLDFNPLISPHYKVIAVQFGNRNGLEFNVYHSEKRYYETVCFPRQHVNPERRYIALWNGNVYLHYRFPFHSHNGPRPSNPSEDRFMRISGILGGSEENINRKFNRKVITFPKQSKVDARMSSSYLGTWRDRLRFVGVDDHKIRVWALLDSQEDIWTLEHTCAYFFDSIGRSPDDELPYIVGLHPLQNAVLFMFKNLLFAYDLDRMLFEKICEIGDDALLSTRSLVLPFSPCFAKEVIV